MRGALRPLRTTVLAAGAVAALGAVAWWSERAPTPPRAAEVFRFEKEDLVAFTIRNRPDGVDLSFARAADGWTSTSHGFRPSGALVRRAAWQLHDLDARATVGGAAPPTPEELARYGLGPGALTVELRFASGDEAAFAVGALAATGVSAYLRRLPDGPVVVVKRSATDFWGAPVEDFREERVAGFVAGEVTALEADLDDRAVAFARTGARTWEQTRPVRQAASHDAVQRLIGRLLGLRAATFVEDGAADLARYGLAAPIATVTVTVDGGPAWVVALGAPAPGDGLRYAAVPGDAPDRTEVVTLRDALLDDFRADPATWREQRLLPDRLVSDLVGITLASDALRSTPDGWRRASGAPAPAAAGLAFRAVELSAEAWVEGPPPEGGAALTLTFADGGVEVLRLAGDLAWVEGRAGLARVGTGLAEAVAAVAPGGGEPRIP